MGTWDDSYQAILLVEEIRLRNQKKHILRACQPYTWHKGRGFLSLGLILYPKFLNTTRNHPERGCCLARFRRGTHLKIHPTLRTKSKLIGNMIWLWMDVSYRCVFQHRPSGVACYLLLYLVLGTTLFAQLHPVWTFAEPPSTRTVKRCLSMCM